MDPTETQSTACRLNILYYIKYTGYWTFWPIADGNICTYFIPSEVKRILHFSVLENITVPVLLLSGRWRHAVSDIPVYQVK